MSRSSCKFAGRCPLLLLPLLAVAGCQGDWPDLGRVPETTAVTPQAPITLPVPRRSVAPLDAAAARDALAILPERYERLKLRISGQLALYQRARAEAEASGDPVAVRGAQVQLSRLSPLETELVGVMDELERIRASAIPADVRAEAAQLAERVRQRRRSLANYAAAERLELAALSGSD